MALLPPRPLPIAGVVFRETLMGLAVLEPICGGFVWLGLAERQDMPVLAWTLVALLGGVGVLVLGAAIRKITRIVLAGRASKEVELLVVGGTTVVNGDTGRIRSVVSPDCELPDGRGLLHDAGIPLIVVRGGKPWALGLEARSGNVVIVGRDYPYALTAEQLQRIDAELAAAYEEPAPRARARPRSP